MICGGFWGSRDADKYTDKWMRFKDKGRNFTVIRVN